MLHINVVKSGTSECNDLDAKLTQAIDNGGVDSIVYEYAYAVISLSEIDGIFVKLGLKKLEFYIVFFSVFFEGGNNNGKSKISGISDTI